MNECPSCRQSNPDAALVCTMCSARLDRPERGFGSNAELTRGELLEQSALDYAADWQAWHDPRGGRMRRRYKSHGITGIFSFIILLTLAGFPNSFLPLNLLFNLTLSVVVGYPTGYWVSRIGGGWSTGALVSGSICGGLMLLLLCVAAALEGEFDWFEIAIRTAATFAAGLIPGFYIGTHIDLDQ